MPEEERKAVKICIRVAKAKSELSCHLGPVKSIATSSRQMNHFGNVSAVAVISVVTVDVGNEVINFEAPKQ